MRLIQDRVTIRCDTIEAATEDGLHSDIQSRTMEGKDGGKTRYCG